MATLHSPPRGIFLEAITFLCTIAILELLQRRKNQYWCGCEFFTM